MSARLYATALAVAAIQFIVVMQIAQWLYPNYNVWTNYISDLGNRSLAGPLISTLFNASAAALGVLVMASSYGVGRLTTRRAASTVLLGLSGLGALGVGLFPEGSPYGLHTVSALTAFLFGGLAVAALGVYTAVPKALRWLGVAFGAISLASLAAYIALGEPPIVERLVVYPILIYAALYGIYVAAKWG
ncbi:MAG: DUF998 domain-containing protein [Thermoproteus sp.]